MITLETMAKLSSQHKHSQEIDRYCDMVENHLFEAQIYVKNLRGQNAKQRKELEQIMTSIVKEERE